MIGALVCLFLLARVTERPDVGGRIVMPARVKAKADVQAIASAVTSYALENDGRLPDSLEALIRPDENGRTFLDTDELPDDPWGRPYRYGPSAPGTATFRVFTLGADGLPGGDGEDRDIDNLLIKEGKI
jgi:general secretion pathway protein G